MRADYKPTATVDCAGCTACCQHDAIFMHAEDDPSLYKTVPATNPLTGRRGQMIPHKPSGGCLYLGDAGCTIYDHRPVVCRGFTCTGLVLKLTGLPRPERRRLLRSGIVDDAVWQAGLARLPDMRP